MKLVLILVASLPFIVQALPTRQRRFDGNQVLRITPKHQDEIQKILNLGKDFEVDIWKMPKSLNSTMDVHVDVSNIEKFVSELKSLGTEFYSWIENLQDLIDEERKPAKHVKTRAVHSFNMAHYHSLSDINSFLTSVAASSSHANVYTAGRSSQGRDINYIKISTGGSKKAIFIDGGIHAREWIAPAVVVYLIDQLAMNPTNNPTITALVQKFDWYFMPVVNPDGYEYSRLNNRMWRKNRAASHSLFGTCTGVDLNRNFGFHWNPLVGGSQSHCDEIFAGSHAFSEPETLAVKHLMDSIGSHTIAYLNLHSYGQMWLYPWGYTTQLPQDLADLRHLANVGSSGIYQSHHARYKTGGDATDLYPAAGGSDDYAKGGAGIKYSYTIELRDTGRHGFILPASYIIQSGEETLAGIVAFAKELISYEHL